MAGREAVADAFANDDRPKPVAFGVGGRRADAGAGAAARNQQRIYPELDEVAGQMGPEKGAGVFLFDHQVLHHIECHKVFSQVRFLHSTEGF